MNIIGEHTDYNGGFALAMALPQTVTCAAATTSDATVQVTSSNYPGESVREPIATLAAADVRGWVRYPLGVVHEYVRRGHQIPGITLHFESTVPAGAGLSSSAAVECATALALRDLFSLQVCDGELVDIGHAAENAYVGAETGLLDQTASIRCIAGHAVLLDFESGEFTQIPFDLAASGLELLIVDTNTPRRLAAGGYNQRRRECAAAATALGVLSLREITDVAALDNMDVARVVGNEEPGDTATLRRRARHVVTENARVRRVVDILRSSSDLHALGPILSAAHASLRDDFEVSTPALDAAVTSAITAGARGARMIGGGFGGSVIALADQTRTAHIAAHIRKHFHDSGFGLPTTFVAVASPGAHRLA